MSDSSEESCEFVISEKSKFYPHGMLSTLSGRPILGVERLDVHVPDRNPGHWENGRRGPCRHTVVLRKAKGFVARVSLSGLEIAMLKKSLGVDWLGLPARNEHFLSGEMACSMSAHTIRSPAGIITLAIDESRRSVQAHSSTEELIKTAMKSGRERRRVLKQRQEAFLRRTQPVRAIDKYGRSARFRAPLQSIKLKKRH